MSDILPGQSINQSYTPHASCRQVVFAARRFSPKEMLMGIHNTHQPIFVCPACSSTPLAFTQSNLPDFPATVISTKLADRLYEAMMFIGLAIVRASFAFGRLLRSVDNSVIGVATYALQRGLVWLRIYASASCTPACPRKHSSRSIPSHVSIC